MRDWGSTFELEMCLRFDYGILALASLHWLGACIMEREVMQLHSQGLGMYWGGGGGEVPYGRALAWDTAAGSSVL